MADRRPSAAGAAAGSACAGTVGFLLLLLMLANFALACFVTHSVYVDMTPDADALPPLATALRRQATAALALARP